MLNDKKLRKDLAVANGKLRFIPVLQIMIAIASVILLAFFVSNDQSYAGATVFILLNMLGVISMETRLLRRKMAILEDAIKDNLNNS